MFRADYFYPDVMVTCSRADRDPLIVREPRVVIEVLSPSTAAYDRGDKFAAYRMLSSLRELVLVDPATRRVDLFRLDEARAVWSLHPSAPDEPVVLASLDGLTITPAELWADVDLAPGDAAA